MGTTSPSSVLLISALSLLHMHLAAAAHDLSQEYAFSAVLDGAGDYQLFWSYDLEEKTISFAVNVSTTGWVGFGISPNGQMPGSDVVIGWVENDGNTIFHDRYAVDRYLPPIDDSQDWRLLSGEEQDGYTILEFTRDLTNCDKYDINIEADTARIVWSYHSEDPSDPSNIDRHEKKGSASINLLGGLNTVEKDREGSQSFLIANENLTIPDADTTYWCTVHELSSEVLETEHYIYKFSPKIAAETARYVHHIVIYVCDTLNQTNLGSSAACDDAHVNVQMCRGTATVLGVWAVGGIDFYYPEDVAYPIGGPHHPRYIVLEMHYDNPDMDSGKVDSSGLEFFYTDTAPVNRAGVLIFGHHSTPSMVIPPDVASFAITGVCPGSCTESFFPEDGINVFGSFLHTHLAGYGLVSHHFRQNEECGVLEELEPIDTNLKYDFNYQQINVLPRTVKVLPGDSLVLECFYRTNRITNVTLGGESTREEMCLDFLYYYPQMPLSYCGSSPSIPDSYSPFVSTYIDTEKRPELYAGFAQGHGPSVERAMENVQWTPEAVAMLQQTYYSNATSVCLNSVNPERSQFVTGQFPVTSCDYEAPDVCTGNELLSCCERISAASPLALRHHYLLAILMATITSCTLLLSM